MINMARLDQQLGMKRLANPGRHCTFVQLVPGAMQIWYWRWQFAYS